MIVGCDPGISGALAFMDDEGRLVGVEDMPVLDDGTKRSRTVNAVLLAAIPVTMLAVPSWRRAVGLPPGATKDQARGEAIGDGRSTGNCSHGNETMVAPKPA